MSRYYVRHVTIAVLGFVIGAVFATIVAPGSALVLIATGTAFGFAACALFDQDFGGDWFWPFGRRVARKAVAVKHRIGRR